MAHLCVSFTAKMVVTVTVITKRKTYVATPSNHLGVPQLRDVDPPILYSEHTANVGQHQLVAGQDDEGDVEVVCLRRNLCG